MQLTHLQDGRFTPVEVKRVLLVECNTRMSRGNWRKLKVKYPKKLCTLEKERLRRNITVQWQDEIDNVLYL